MSGLRPIFRQRQLPRSLLAALIVFGAAQVPWSVAQDAADKKLRTAEASDEGGPAEPPLIEREPYDWVRLRGGEELKIKPLEKRAVPKSPRPGESLSVQLPDYPGESFELAWRDVAEFKLFEQMLLEEAERLTATNHRDEAYQYYQFLRARYPTLEGLPRSVSDFWAAEAETALNRGATDRALGLYYEILQADEDYPELSERLGVATDRLVEQYVKVDELAKARGFLKRLAAAFAEHPVVRRWNEELGSRCNALLTQAASLRSQDRWPDALLAAQSALRLLPESADARQAVAELTTAARWIAVGVKSTAQAVDPASLDDWAARRVSRLLAPGLYELQGYSTEGGDYATTFGAGTPLELQRRITLVLRGDIRPANGGEALTGRDLALQLIERADSRSPGYSPGWAQVFQSVSVTAVQQVEIEYRESGLRPEAWLQFPIVRANGTAETRTSSAALGDDWMLGRYRVTSLKPDRLDFQSHPTSDESQSQFLTERLFRDHTQAMAALERGEIALIDRLAPWQVAAAKANPRLTVEPYGVPTVCVLLPNTARPLPANRTFRRAIQYGLHRKSILELQLVRGPLADGTQLATGPFPVDSYAHNPEVRPREYEPYLAKTLLQIAFAQVPAAKDDANPRAVVISHPGHEVARVACQAIERQIERLGLTVHLVEQEPAAAAARQDYDFRYAELFVSDPAIDACRLFGASGIVGAPTAYLERAIRQLAASTDWPSARAELQQVHRLVHEELAVIPLWQLREYLVYDRRLGGIPARPVALYASVESWKLEPWSPAP